MSNTGDNKDLDKRLSAAMEEVTRSEATRNEETIRIAEELRKTRIPANSGTILQEAVHEIQNAEVAFETANRQFMVAAEALDSSRKNLVALRKEIGVKFNNFQSGIDTKIS